MMYQEIWLISETEFLENVFQCTECGNSSFIHDTLNVWVCVLCAGRKHTSAEY